MLAAGALLACAGLASAHEHRDVGNYTLVVGFLDEPAIANEPNGLSLRVETKPRQPPPRQPPAPPLVRR